MGFTSHSILPLAAITLVVLGGCGRDRDEKVEETPPPAEREIVLLAGTPDAFSAYLRRADRSGPKALAVAGMSDDLPGLSDGLDALRTLPLAAGRIIVVPSPGISGGDIRTSFPPQTAPGATPDAPSALMTLADTSDVLVVVTEQTGDAGNTIFYGPEAGAAAAAAADRIAAAINGRLPEAETFAETDFDEFYAVRDDKSDTFIGWAAERGTPGTAIEIALFGGHGTDLSRLTQAILARYAVATALVELGVLDRDAIQRAVTEPIAGGEDIAMRAARDEIPAVPPRVRYRIDGVAATHAPGELWALPSRGRVTIDRVEGVPGYAIDLASVDSEFSVEDLAEDGPCALRARHLWRDSVLWSEPILVGGSPVAGRAALRTELGAHPRLASFPPRETWLFLTGDPGNDIRIRHATDRPIIGSRDTLREYAVESNGRTIGVLLSPRWARSPHLVDVQDVNDRERLDPPILIEMRYATARNFFRQDLYNGDNRCLVRSQVAAALARAQRDLAGRGYGLKMLDGYRPLAVQKRMWAIKPDANYVAPPTRGSHHNLGIAVDVTLVDAAGREVAMPTEYDAFTPRAWQGATDGLTEEQIANRDLLRAAMVGAGFAALRTEWWHFVGPGKEGASILDLPLDTGWEREPSPAGWFPARVVAR